MSTTVERLPNDFGWFSDWVGQQLGLCLTFALGLSCEQMLDGFRVRPCELVRETFADASSDPSRPKVRIGDLDGWAYAVEHLTTAGSEPQTLCRLSVASEEAFSLAYSLTVCTFLYAASGDLVSGFDLTAPHVRYGRDQHRFDLRMEQAGFFRPGVPDPPAMSARFIQLTFGIAIDRHMLERALPSGELV